MSLCFAIVSNVVFGCNFHDEDETAGCITLIIFSLSCGVFVLSHISLT